VLQDHVCVTWLIYVMTHVCVWHDSFMWYMTYVCMTSLICVMTHVCVTLLIHVVYGTHIHQSTSSHEYIHEFTWVMWTESSICNMTHSRVTQHLCVTWLIYVSHDSFTCDMTHSRVTQHVNMSTSARVCVCARYQNASLLQVVVQH